MNARTDPRWRAAEIGHLTWIVDELSRLSGQGMLGEEGHRLLAWFHWRFEALAAPARSATAWTPPQSPVAPAPPSPPATPARRGGAGGGGGGGGSFELREFLTNHAILLLSYAGAALLVTSTLLFLVYGPDGIGGGGRAAAIAGLNAVLGGIAALSSRHERIRVVAPPYTAMAAVSLPLTLTAIYGYVVSGATGMSVPTAIALAGAACAAVYTSLALGLGSRAYAAMALGAGAAAAASGAVATDLGFVWLPAAAAVAAAGWWLAARPEGDRLAPFVTPALVLAAATTLDAPVVAALAAAAGATPGWLAGGHPIYLPLTLALVGAAAAAAPRAVSTGWRWLGGAMVSLVPWTAAWSVGGDATARAVALTASGAVVGALAAVVAGRGHRRAGIDAAGALTGGAAAYLVAAVAATTALPSTIVTIAVATVAGAAIAIRGVREQDGASSFLGAAVAVAATIAATSAAGAQPESWPVVAPIGLAIGLCGVLVTAIVRRSEALLATLGFGLTAVSLTAVSAWHAGQAAYPMALAAQAAAQTALLPLLSGRLRMLTAWGAALRLAVAACVVVSPLELQLGIGCAIAAVAIALAAMGGTLEPSWRLPLAWFASGAAGLAWYWATAEAVGTALVPAEPFAVSTLAFGAVLAAVVALVLAQRRDGAAASGAGCMAAVAMAAGTLTALGDRDWALAAAALGVLAVATWFAGAVKREWASAATAGAALFAAGADLAATMAAGLGSPLRIALLVVPAVAIRLAIETEPGAPSDRRGAARWSAIAVAAAAAAWAAGVATTIAPFGPQPGDPTQIAAAGALASVVAVVLLVMDGSLLERCAALVGAGLAADWISVALQEIDIQAYVVAPSIAVVAAGLVLRSRRAGTDAGAAALAVGLGTLLGSSALQALADGGWYTPWLLAEAIAVMFAAVVVRSRTCAVAAGAAVLGVCLRAVGDASTTIPLYALLAGGAALLLGVSLTMALARQQVDQARLSAAAGWARWGA